MLCTMFDFIPSDDENMVLPNPFHCDQALIPSFIHITPPIDLNFFPEPGRHAFKLKGDGIVDDFKSQLFLSCFKYYY